MSRGRWSDEAWRSIQPGGLGLLVIEGVLACRVSIGDRSGTELLGAGDLVGSSRPDNAIETLPLSYGGTVLSPIRIALLDAQFVRRELERYPELAAALVARAGRRIHSLAVNLALVSHPRIEVRLYLLLWHLADRWGRVRPEGVRLPFRLTHSLLAELVAARRPTVTSALAELTRRDLVRQTPDGLLLMRGWDSDGCASGVFHTCTCPPLRALGS